MIIIGIDPHFRKLAFTVIEYRDGERRHVLTEFHTTPNLKKGVGNIQKAAETNHVLRDLFNKSHDFFVSNPFDAVGIEAYQAIPGRSANAPKMIGAVCAVKCAAFSLGKMPMEYSSAQLRRMILKKPAGSKQEMWDAVHGLYGDIKWPEIPEKEKEHIYDSLVLAEAALVEILEIQSFIGDQ